MNHPILTATVIAALASTLSFSANAQQQTFDNAEMAGISGLRTMWDTPVPLAADGATTEGAPEDGRFGITPTASWSPDARSGEPGAAVFDAVHRSLLVRFPGAAERIAAELASGKKVTKVELVLPFKGIELWPEGYNLPAALSFIGDQWKTATDTPRWHAIAWALRQPWNADPEKGPTYNASVNGEAYWTKFGAQNETEDRVGSEFGPAEVSKEVPDGRLDVTAALTDEAFGATPAERLRNLEFNGFLVRKEETYDATKWQGGYEWTTPRGAHGIFVEAPKLVVTYASGPAVTIPAEDLAAPGPHTPAGEPTAVMPTPEEFEEFAEKFAFQTSGVDEERLAVGPRAGTRGAGWRQGIPADLRGV